MSHVGVIALYEHVHLCDGDALYYLDVPDHLLADEPMHESMKRLARQEVADLVGVDPADVCTASFASTYLAGVHRRHLYEWDLITRAAPPHGSIVAYWRKPPVTERCTTCGREPSMAYRGTGTCGARCPGKPPEPPEPKAEAEPSCAT